MFRHLLLLACALTLLLAAGCTKIQSADDMVQDGRLRSEQITDQTVGFAIAALLEHPDLKDGEKLFQTAELYDFFQAKVAPRRFRPGPATLELTVERTPILRVELWEGNKLQGHLTADIIPLTKGRVLVSGLSLSE